jgi:hypothetical protein
MSGPWRRVSRADGLAVLALLAAALVLGAGRIVLRPDLLYTEEYVVGEHGNQLYRAERLARGLWLYRDVADQYGPVPAYLYMLYTRAAGNTISANLYWHLGGSLVCLVLAYAVLRKNLAVGPALGGAFAALPLLLAPGGADLGGGYGNFLYIEYLALERCCLLGVMLLWQPPAERSRARSIATGLLLGLWQAVKFGGALFAGAALGIVDVLVVAGLPGPAWSRAVRAWAWTLGAFALLEGGQVALAFGLLPPEVAVDTIWPAYIHVAYSRLSSWPSLHGPFSFLADQLLPLACALTAAGALGMWLFRLRRPSQVTPEMRREAGVLLGAIFYGLAATAYLGHNFLFYQYAWVLLFPAARVVTRFRPRLGNIAFVVVTVPLVLMGLTTFVAQPEPGLIDYSLPGGDRLRIQPFVRPQLEAMAALPREGRPTDFVVALLDWSGGGYHHFFNPGYGLRNYLVTEGAFRPYDDAELSAKLGRVEAFLIRKDGRLDPEAKIRSVFSRKLADRILDRFSLDADRSTEFIAVFSPRTEAVARGSILFPGATRSANPPGYPVSALGAEAGTWGYRGPGLGVYTEP